MISTALAGVNICRRYILSELIKDDLVDSKCRLRNCSCARPQLSDRYYLGQLSRPIIMQFYNNAIIPLCTESNERTFSA